MIVVLGGGIIGLMIGWRLRKRGVAVHVVEARQAGQQASWAAAGMLTPSVEVPPSHEKLLSLCHQSLSLYPHYLQELSQDSGLQIAIEQTGVLLVAMNRDELFYLYHRYGHVKGQWLDGAEIRALEPFLSPTVVGGIHIPNEGHIDNRQLIVALKQAFLTLGGQLTEGNSASEVIVEKGRIAAVQLKDGACLQADYVINCCGAWASLVGPLPPHVIPINGQIITMSMHDRPLLSHLVRTSDVYLVPKQNGTMRIGATSEEVGFEPIVTAGGVQQLLEEASRVLPAIASYRWNEVRAALRPQTPDGLPVVGQTAIEGYYHACGHGRHGILLAPITAYQLVEEILCQPNATVTS